MGSSSSISGDNFANHRRRTWAALIFLESIASHTTLLSTYWLMWDYGLLFQFPPQVWRLLTSFSLTGGISIIFLPYMGKKICASAVTSG